MKGTDSDYPGLSRRLTRLRNGAGLTRQELADRAGVTFNTINDIEKGRRRHPMEKTLQSLANVLSVSYDYLATGAEEDGVAPQAGRWRRVARAQLTAAGLVVSALVVIAATHARWETSRETVGLECMVRDPGGAFGSPHFEDVDADGMVELIRSSNVGRPWSIVDIDDSAPDTWKFEPALALGCEEASHTGSFTYDLQGDGRKELLNLCRAEDNCRIEARDSRTGEVRLVTVIPPPLDPESHEEIVDVVRDFRRSTDLAFLTAASESSSGGDVRCVDVQTGRELWSHDTEQQITAVGVAPSAAAARYDVFVWSRADDAPDSPSATRARVTAIDDEGGVCWRRPAGERGAGLTGCLLKEASGEASLVVVVANNHLALPTRPSHLLLLDAHTGARVDSLPYTDLVVNGPLSRLHDDGNGWDVFCGTEHGFVRRYHVVDGHIREESSRRIATHWVWTQDFLGGSDADGAIVVATADNVCYVVDADLRVLFRRRGDDGAPISPVTTFTDPSGDSYVAFVCHGNDLCIDRFVTLSGWGTRRWYVAAYALALGMLIATRTPVRRRVRTVLASSPFKRIG